MQELGVVVVVVGQVFPAKSKIITNSNGSGSQMLILPNMQMVSTKYPCQLEPSHCIFTSGNFSPQQTCDPKSHWRPSWDTSHLLYNHHCSALEGGASLYLTSPQNLVGWLDNLDKTTEDSRAMWCIECCCSGHIYQLVHIGCCTPWGHR